MRILSIAAAFFAFAMGAAPATAGDVEQAKKAVNAATDEQLLAEFQRRYDARTARVRARELSTAPRAASPLAAADEATLVHAARLTARTIYGDRRPQGLLRSHGRQREVAGARFGGAVYGRQRAGLGRQRRVEDEGAEGRAAALPGREVRGAAERRLLLGNARRPRYGADGGPLRARNLRRRHHRHASRNPLRVRLLDEGRGDASGRHSGGAGFRRQEAARRRGERRARLGARAPRPPRPRGDCEAGRRLDARSRPEGPEGVRDRLSERHPAEIRARRQRPRRVRSRASSWPTSTSSAAIPAPASTIKPRKS